ncbi:MAG: hypothetical protein ABIQ41_02790 [Gemmatimonadales bacterium]
MRAIQWWFIAGLAVTAACTDQRDPSSLADESQVQPVPRDEHGDRRSAQERLARRVAKAMRSPEFRAWVRSSLDGSQFREHKLPFARTLGQKGGRGVRALAEADSSDEGTVQRDLEAADGLEFYFPVPAHRAAWTGGEDILVATEVNDHETPVAFDTRGRRMVLDATTPPSTPVLAVVPQETDFDAPPGPQSATSGGICLDPVSCDSNPPPPTYFPTAPPPGLYMTYFNAVDDFEGWLKGSPELEVHILAPKLPGDTVTYKTIWCIGEKSTAKVYWDSDNLTWRGNLLIYPQAQLSAFHTQFPGQDFSVLVLEDDDEACTIRVDRDLISNFLSAVSRFSRDYKATKDTSSGAVKYVKAARSGYDLWTATADFFQTNDDIIGAAIANTVTGLVNSEAGWGLFGENANRNGWLGLKMQ